MANPDQAPVVVSASAAPGQIMAALRSFALALVAYAAGRGWIDATLGYSGAGLVLVLLPAGWSQLSTWFRHRTLVTVARAAPNDAAVVR